MFDRMLQEARETNNFHLKKQLKAGLYFEDCPMHQQMVHGLFEKDRKKRDGAVEPEPTVQIFNFQLEEASDNKGTQEKRPTMIYAMFPFFFLYSGNFTFFLNLFINTWNPDGLHRCHMIRTGNAY